MQIMTPKARSDVHVNLPALQKLDTMLIVCCHPVIYAYAWFGHFSSPLWHTLQLFVAYFVLVMLYVTKNMQEVMDSMIDTEFWYEESGSRADGRGKITGPRKSKKWWLPSPCVPEEGLSQFQRKRLVFQAKLVHQILKAAKSINEQVLFHMPIPAAVMDALPKVSIHFNLIMC